MTSQLPIAGRDPRPSPDHFAYALRTVSAWRLIGHTTVWATSARAAVEHALDMGYAKAEASPASSANGYDATLPVRRGDTSTSTKAKIATAVAGTVVAVAALAGCSSTGTTAVPTTPEIRAMSDSAKGNVLADLWSDRGFETVGDSAVRLSHSICEAWEAGAAFIDIVGAVQTGTENAGVAGFVVGSATEAFCPEYSGEVA